MGKVGEEEQDFYENKNKRRKKSFCLFSAKSYPPRSATLWVGGENDAPLLASKNLSSPLELKLRHLQKNSAKTGRKVQFFLKKYLFFVIFARPYP